MAHYAQIINNKVANVIVAEESFVVSNLAGEWLKTSYNTRGGLHTKGGVPLRKNFACIGGEYDRDKDAFILPQSYPSWTLNEDTCQYEPPIPYPADGEAYSWNEETTNWVAQ